MSYILDALKRADAERERGRVPGLHAQSAAPASGAGEPRRALPPIAWLAGGVVLLGGVAAVAWRLGADTQPTVTPAPAPAVALTQEMSPTAPAPHPQATLPPPVTATAPPAAQAPVVLPGPLAPARPTASDEPPVAAAPGAVATPGPARGTAASPSAAQPPAPAPAPAPATARVPTLAELPAATRRELPALSVGGSVYSDDPAARFFLLNGEVAKEGAQPLPGLVVERIEPRGAVMRYRDQRFRLPF